MSLSRGLTIHEGWLTKLLLEILYFIQKHLIESTWVAGKERIEIAVI
jgi:hypothetical protein